VIGDKPLLTVSEVACLTGLPASTIYQSIRRGDFPIEPVRIGQRVWLPRSQLWKLLGEEPPSEEPPSVEGSRNVLQVVSSKGRRDGSG
jgi:excisionase family DNA binding protein